MQARRNFGRPSARRLIVSPIYTRGKSHRKPISWLDSSLDCIYGGSLNYQPSSTDLFTLESLASIILKQFADTMMSDKFFPEQHAPLSTQTMSATADHDTPMPDAPGEKDPRVELPPGHGEGVSNPKKRTLTRIIRNDPKKTDDSHQRSGTRELGGNIAKTFKTFGSRMSGGSSEEQYLEQKTPHKNEDESEDLRALRHSPSMQEQDRERSKKPEKELDHSLRNKGHELGEMSKGAEEYKIKWKKACQELSRLREQGQGYYQLADSDVTGLFSHLRKIIHDFAIQYFDGKSLNLSLTKESPNYLDLIQRQHTTKEDEYNSVNCEQRIQAIIWSIVETQVFNTYAWIGNETSKQFICLQNKLQPSGYNRHHAGFLRLI